MGNIRDRARDKMNNEKVPVEKILKVLKDQSQK
jgi:hypothetical protein